MRLQESKLSIVEGWSKSKWRRCQQEESEWYLPFMWKGQTQESKMLVET